MKKSNTLAAAVALILSTGTASAAFDTGHGFATESAKPSSLVFSAVNDVDKQTFVFNLSLPTTSGLAGLNYADFAANASTFAGNANGGSLSQRVNDALSANGGQLVWDLTAYPAFGSFISNVANLRWSVLGGYEKDNAAGSNYDKYGVEPEFDGLYTDTYNSQWGALVSAPSINHLDPNNIQALISIPSDSGSTGAYLSKVNSKIVAEGEPNGDVASLDPINGKAFYDTAVLGWEASLLPGVPTKSGAGEYGFFWATNPFADGKNQFFEIGKFTLNLDGKLAFASVAQPAPIPVPGAVWLFGSALAGFLGVTRRRA